MSLRAVSLSLLVVGSVVASAACSDDPVDPAAAIDVAVVENAAALCERLFTCCTPSELDELAFVDVRVPPTLEGCKALHEKTQRDYVASTNAEASASRIAIHLDRSASCAAEVRAVSCPDFHARLLRLHLGDAFALCNGRVVEPLVPDDGACKLYVDCQSGNCVGGAKGNELTSDAKGTCEPFPAAGEPCAADGCAEGMRCDPDTNLCADLVPKGGDCSGDAACASGACKNEKCASPGRCGG